MSRPYKYPGKIRTRMWEWDWSFSQDTLHWRGSRWWRVCASHTHCQVFERRWRQQHVVNCSCVRQNQNRRCYSVWLIHVLSSLSIDLVLFLQYTQDRSSCKAPFVGDLLALLRFIGPFWIGKDTCFRVCCFLNDAWRSMWGSNFWQTLRTCEGRIMVSCP